ncbi:hypothetical protein WR25_09221 [Diploscapter pachys]|uniref:Kazal-like domain-containing protein n=1 Tax=Diploscapter pachys TaxID=2018661 RepID=A0A2A2KU16_9BILA|nr:hypothetical protein WR25_09221 [Diploscapter pachys]
MTLKLGHFSHFHFHFLISVHSLDTYTEGFSTDTDNVIPIGSNLGAPQLVLKNQLDALRFKSIIGSRKRINHSLIVKDPREYLVPDITKSTRDPAINYSTDSGSIEVVDRYGTSTPYEETGITSISPTFNESRTSSSSTEDYLDQSKPCSAEMCNKRTWKPVCDNRNNTHRNICLFKFFACKVYKTENIRIEMTHEGPCLPEPEFFAPTTPDVIETTTEASEIPMEEDCQPCPVTEQRVEICDNQKMTLPNLCRVIWFNCILRKRGESERVISHIGRCAGDSPIYDVKDEMCPEDCPVENQNVCSVDNQTFANFCEFQRFACNRRKKGLPNVELRHMRACDEPEVNQVKMILTETVMPVQPFETTTETPQISTSLSHADSHFRILIPTVNMKELGVERFESSTESIFAGSGAELDDFDHFGFQPHTMINEEPPLAASTQITATDPRTSSTKMMQTREENFECPEPRCQYADDSLDSIICDSEGKLHENLCEFTYARCLAARNGIFLSVQPEEKCTKDKCQFDCSSSIHYVCGNDFVNYRNLCSFRRQKCLLPSLDILFHGKCEECLQAPCPQLPASAPDDHFVCDADNQTRSICEFKMLSCIINKNYGINLTINHVGKCCKNGPCKDGKEPPKINRTTEEKDKYPTPEAFRGTIPDRDMHMTISAPTTFNGEQCPSECDNDYSPVCATNSVTYTNLCHLQDAKCRYQMDIQIAYTGECCDEMCPDNFSPVCDSENITHQNLCYFGKQRCITERVTGKNISISKYDVCSAEEAICSFDCPKQYNPICASNGETIVNLCELERLNCFVKKNVTMGKILTIDYNGTCCPEDKCGFEFAPVCDTNYSTHANECLFRQKACIENRKFGRHLTILYPDCETTPTQNLDTNEFQLKGQCCQKECSKMRAPVCDGARTHKNMCVFKSAQCEAEKRGEILQLAYTGQCCAIQRPCLKTGKICDSEGETHPNICHFRQKKCILSRTAKKILSVVHEGECCLLKSCSKTAQPVCDDRGGTHLSLCHFQNTKCIHDKIHPQNALQLAYLDKCCQNECTGEFSPVCDQMNPIQILQYEETKKVKNIRTREEFLSNCSRWNPYFIFVTIAMGVNWGLSGFFLVAPAYISSAEFKDNNTEFWKVQDEFALNSTWLNLPEYVATSFSAGNLIIGPVFSVLSDRYGRRGITIISILWMGLGGIACAIVPNFETLLIARFIQGSFYAVSSKNQYLTISSNLANNISDMGIVQRNDTKKNSFKGVRHIRNVVDLWKRIGNCPMKITINTLEESLEYLLLVKDKKSAMRLIDKIQRREERIIEIDIDSMMSNAEKKRMANQNSSASFFWHFKSNPKFVILIGICTYMSFTSTLLHNAMALTSTVISVGNAHVNFVLSSLVEIPSYLTVPMLQKWLGKIYTLFLFHSVTAISNIFLSFLSSELIFHSVFWFLAKFACSSAFMCILILGSQEFPVECRNISIGICATIGNIGAVIAPQLELLNHIRPNLMFQVFAVCSGFATFLSLAIPKSEKLDQVVGQSLAAAACTVDDCFIPHSLHSYFIKTGSVDKPILYTIDRIRDGRSFCTRIVKAIQDGEAIFSCQISFHKKERDAIVHQHVMPSVPDPESLKDARTVAEDYLSLTSGSEEKKVIIEHIIKEVNTAFERVFDVRPVDSQKFLLGSDKPESMIWIKAREDIGEDHRLHQCVAAYLTDLSMINTAIRPHAAKDGFVPSMSFSLDHNVWFHEPDFRVDDWMLYETVSTKAGGSRAFIEGRLWTKDGRLVVSTAQEALIRDKPTTSNQ